MKQEKEKKLLFSLTAKDFIVQTFCTGGNGGQHRNAKQNGVRIIHAESGARAEHRDGRDQSTNRVKAFEKLVETSAFKAWHKMEVAKRLGRVKIAEDQVEEIINDPNNFKVEVKTSEGWKQVDIKDLQ